MSLLKWKELAKRKSELGDKINYVHDTITKHKLCEKTSQESLAKVFKPVTAKLDDVTISNLKIPNRKLKRGKKKGILLLVLITYLKSIRMKIWILRV